MWPAQDYWRSASHSLYNCLRANIYWIYWNGTSHSICIPLISNWTRLKGVEKREWLQQLHTFVHSFMHYTWYNSFCYILLCAIGKLKVMYIYNSYPSLSHLSPPLPSPPLHFHFVLTCLLTSLHSAYPALLPLLPSHYHSPCMHVPFMLTDTYMQDLRLLLNLLTFSVPLPWCVSTTLPTHGVALLGYLSPLLALTTLIVYSIMWVPRL